METNAQTTDRKQVTVEMVSGLLHEAPDARNDPRVRILIDLANAHEKYTEAIEWHARNMNELVRRNVRDGLNSVWETVMSSSLISDIATQAAKIEALRRVLECTTADETDAVSAFIRRHVSR